MESNLIILYILVGHWFLSLAFHSIFLHRYGAHHMFTMSKGWERVFYFLTFLVQGATFLSPRAYGILHRMHHAYSDTERDPHTPVRFHTVFGMLGETIRVFRDIFYHPNKPEYVKMGKNLPEWNSLDHFADHWLVRAGFVLLYVGIYFIFAPSFWFFLLIPIHIVMGPLQGAMVNWCGHKYGYVNFRETNDHSKNTIPFDFLGLGELFQNNHHRFPSSPNFAQKWFEIDFGYVILFPLKILGILHFRDV